MFLCVPWRSEGDLRCISWSFSVLFSEQGLSLNLGQLANPRDPLSLPPQYCTLLLPRFPVDSRDPTSDPHAGVEGSLPSDHFLPEPSLPLLIKPQMPPHDHGHPRDPTQSPPNGAPPNASPYDLGIKFPIHRVWGAHSDHARGTSRVH